MDTCNSVEHGESTLNSDRWAQEVNSINQPINKMRLSVAQGIERWPGNQRVDGSVPNLSTCLGFEPGPR